MLLEKIGSLLKRGKKGDRLKMGRLREKNRND